MHTTCVNSKDNAKSNDFDHSFVIREITRLKHRCPYFGSSRIGRMQLSCKSIKLSAICGKSSLKSNLKKRISCLSTSLVT